MSGRLTLPSGRQFNASEVTMLLRHRGYLPCGEVDSISQAPFPMPFTDDGHTATAVMSSVNLGFSGEADVPSRLLLKSALEGRFDLNEHEIQFFDLMRHRQFEEIPSVYASLVDEEVGDTLLLMEDLGPETDRSVYPVPDGFPFNEKAVSLLARIHASWWQADAFAESPFQPMSKTKAEGLVVTVMNAAVNHFFDTLGDALSPDRIRVIEQFRDQISDLLGSHAASFPQTLVHGDPHLWNFFFPAENDSPARLIDWQSWDVDFPARDLSYMMALQWFPERRARFEAPLLAQYRSALAEWGVNISADMLDQDYRVQTLRNLSIPIVMCFSSFPADIWWPHLERIFAAIDDLDCRELLT